MSKLERANLVFLVAVYAIPYAVPWGKVRQGVGGTEGGVDQAPERVGLAEDASVRSYAPCQAENQT